jgi:hypothetical protein
MSSSSSKKKTFCSSSKFKKISTSLAKLRQKFSTPLPSRLVDCLFYKSFIIVNKLQWPVLQTYYDRN